MGIAEMKRGMEEGGGRRIACCLRHEERDKEMREEGWNGMLSRLSA